MVDINQVLTNMRRLRSTWIYPGFAKDEYEKAFKELATNFIQLDDALSNGQELPQDWQKGRSDARTHP